VKNTILAMLIGTLPAIALTGCGGTQDQSGPDVADDAPVVEHVVEQHDGDSHDGMGRDTGAHEADDSPHATEQHGHDSHGDSGHDNHASVAGSPGDPANIDRTVEVAMDDSMRFTPDRLTFGAGETVRFVIRNNGNIPHEFVIGSMSELLEHAEMMRAMPAMQHAEANMLTLAAGAQGEVVWHFDEPSTVDFACLIPGHLEAGMKGVIAVE